MVVAPVYRAFAGTEMLFPALRLVLAGLGAGAAVATLALGARLAGPAVGLAAGTVAALHFGLAAASTTLNVESLSIVLELGAVLLLLGDRRGRHAAAGALAGLAALTRAENQLLVLLLAAWAGLTSRRRFAVRRALLVLAGAAVVVLPWSVRNARAIDHFNRTRAATLAEPLRRFAPVTGYGGLNFALANHPAASGGFSRAPLSGASDGRLDLGRPDHLRYLNHGFALGLGWIRDDPRRFLRLVGQKVAIGLEALRLGYGVRDRPAGLVGERRAVDFFRPDRTFLVLPHVLLIGAGTVVLARRAGGRVFILAHLPLITHAVALVLFFGYVRLVLVVMPVLLVSGATAGVAGWEALARRLGFRPGRRGVAGAALVLALAVLEAGYLAARGGQQIRYEGETEVGGTRVNLDGRLRLWPDDAGEQR